MYRVIWTKAAERDLAETWLNSADRNAVTFAAASIDAVLGRYPLRAGESRESSVHRVGYFGSLYAEFEIIEDDKKVIVQAVASSE